MNNKGCLIGIIGFAVLLVVGVLGIGFLGFTQFKSANTGVKVVSSETSEEKPVIADVTNIKLRIVKAQKLDSGISYSLELTNNSGVTIAQNNVYFGYRVKGPGAQISMSRLRVEAQVNRLNILPGKTITLKVFIPQTELEGNKNFLINEPCYDIEGYFESVAEANHFSNSGDFEKN